MSDKIRDLELKLAKTAGKLQKTSKYVEKIVIFLISTVLLGLIAILFIKEVIKMILS